MDRRLDAKQMISLGLLVMGVLLLLDQLGLPVAGFTWPVVLGLVGVLVIWRQLDEEAVRHTDAPAPDPDRAVPVPGLPTPAPLPDGPAPSIVQSRNAWSRIGAGALFVIVGAFSLLSIVGAVPALRQGLVAFVVIVAGMALIFGPWFVRVVGDLGTERSRRIRSEERAEVAAHLHDGVLQTLALIQRSADDPAQVARLARVQERELRGWLFGSTDDAGVTVASAVRRIVAEVEGDYDVVIDEVTVGGGVAVDECGEAVIGAVREAVTNAAKHSGAQRVDVYVEVAPHGISATVRDRGRGFDPRAIADDRQGFRQSVKGRIERAGGRVRVRTGAGEGTEIEMEVPR